MKNFKYLNETPLKKMLHYIIKHIPKGFFKNPILTPMYVYVENMTILSDFVKFDKIFLSSSTGAKIQNYDALRHFRDKVGLFCVLNPNLPYTKLYLTSGDL